LSIAMRMILGLALEHRFGENGGLVALALFKCHLVLSWLCIQSGSGRRIADMKKPRRGFPPGAHFVSFNFPNRSFQRFVQVPAKRNLDALHAVPPRAQHGPVMSAVGGEAAENCPV
jgi:hypothetical protein